MKVSDLTELKLIKYYDLFNELICLILFLDIFLNFYYGETILTYKNWDNIFSVSNFGIMLCFIFGFYIYRHCFSVFVCSCIYKFLFYLNYKREIILNNKNMTSQNGYENVELAKCLSFDEKNEFLEKRINSFLKNKRKALRISTVSVGNLMLCLMELILHHNIKTIYKSLPIFWDIFITLMILSFILICFFIIHEGYLIYWNDKIYCHKPVKK